MADQDRIPDEAARNEIRFQTENIAFAPVDLVTCGGCERQNPPNRPNCLYCGDALAVSDDRIELVKPVLRRLESWESGFSVIARANIAQLGLDLAAIGRVTGLGPESVQALVNARQPMPVAMLGTQREADIIAAALKKHGVDAFVINDHSLDPDRPPVRLRAIEFNDDSLTLIDFNSGNSINVPRADLALIVPGMISESRTDQLEKKRRGKETKVLDEFGTEHDEAVVDIYIRGEATGYRIMLTGFDFSCLGKDKSYIAVENIRRLVTVIHEFAPGAKVNADYLKLRGTLASVWPLDTRKDSRGMQRSGFGRTEFGSRITSSNLRQLNRFSRLQWHLL